MVTFRPELQLTGMSGSLALLKQPGSVIMSMTHVTIGGHGRADPSGLGTEELVPNDHLSKRAGPTPERNGPSVVGSGELSSPGWLPQQERWPCTWKSWPHPLIICAGELALTLS